MCAREAVVYGATYFYNTKAGPDLKYLFDKKFLKHEIENVFSLIPLSSGFSLSLYCNHSPYASVDLMTLLNKAKKSVHMQCSDTLSAN